MKHLNHSKTYKKGVATENPAMVSACESFRVNSSVPVNAVIDSGRKKRPMTSNVRLVLCGICCFTTLAAHGGETNPPPPAAENTNAPIVYLGEFLVVAHRETRNLLATPTLESASLDIATATVEAEDIRLQDAKTLAESVEFSTGVLTEKRGRKEKELISFRGQMYPYPDYALNGVWQRAFAEVPSFFPAAAIERVEILRSGGAILVGPNAGLVGAINVVPRRFDTATTLFDVEGGSFGSYQASLVRGDRLSQGDYTVGANFYSTDGPKGENAGERFTSLFGTAGWEPTDTVSFEFTGYGLTGDRELRLIQDPGKKSLQNRKDEEFSPYTSYGGILRTLLKHSDSASTEIDGGYVYRNGRYHYTPTDTSKPEITNDEMDQEFSAGLLHAHRLGEANTLRLGAQYNRWICPDGKRYFVGKRMDIDTLAGVIMDEHQWDRLTLDGGVRITQSYYRDYIDNTIDTISVSQQGTGAGSSLFGKTIKNEWGDPDPTGTLGIRYRLNDPVALYAHAAFGMVDAPPGAVSETTNSLQRETRITLDGGIGFFDASLGSIKAGLFATFRPKAILLTMTEVTDDGASFNAYANRDLRQYGLELEFRSARIIDIFSIFGNATLMDSEQLTDGDWNNCREIPDMVAAAGVNSLIGRVDVNLFAKYVSRFENKRFAEDGQYHDLGNYVDLNLTTGVTLGRDKATRVYASLKNLLNDRYSTVVGFPDYGFEAFGGLQHRF